MGIELADFHTLALRRDGQVLHVTLNRPEVRNAMSQQMVRELSCVLGQAEMKGDTRVLVLRGAGGHFCAGADIKDLVAVRAAIAADPQALAAADAHFGELCVAFAGSGIAIVAVLQGSVMGGGFGLACVADVAIADRSVAFRLPETSLGVVPAQIAPFLVERLGCAEARRMAVTGGRLDAQQALALRLVHELSDDLDGTLARVLGEILQCAPGALAATKALVARARFARPADLVQDAAQAFSQSALGPEGVEGSDAFLARRKPKWAPP